MMGNVEVPFMWRNQFFETEWTKGCVKAMHPLFYSQTEVV